MSKKGLLTPLITTVIILSGLVWLFWPALLALTVGINLTSDTCSSVSLLNDLSGTYNSLNSLLTLVLAFGAIYTLRVQHQQLLDINHQSNQGRVISLINTYYQLEPERDFDQRCHLLHTLAIVISSFNKQASHELAQSVKPRLNELEEIKKQDIFKQHPWILEHWS